MSPSNIIEKALAMELDVIAITDHNMTENSFYVQELGRKRGIAVLAGMELQTIEEIHMLALFDRYSTALEFQETMYKLLPDVANNVDFYGDQVVVDERNEIIRAEQRLLLNSVQISIDDAAALVKQLNGIAIPSHIDSPTFSIISQLGYIPEHIAFDALEIRRLEKSDEFSPFIMRKNLPFVTFSDAHYLNEIGRRTTTLEMEEASCSAVADSMKMLGLRQKG
jgi:PHP family Zn ribbon phosphoesterase